MAQAMNPEDLGNLMFMQNKLILDISLQITALTQLLIDKNIITKAEIETKMTETQKQLKDKLKKDEIKSRLTI